MKSRFVSFNQVVEEVFKKDHVALQLLRLRRFHQHQRDDAFAVRGATSNLTPLVPVFAIGLSDHTRGLSATNE